MFEFRRELKRIFQAESLKDGLVAGDPSLLELLELNLLLNEAKAADIAAARIGADDRPARQLEAAAIWREIARRTGDGRDKHMHTTIEQRIRVCRAAGGFDTGEQIGDIRRG